MPRLLAGNRKCSMIEMLFRLGFALACGIGAMALMFWVLEILPAWWRKRRKRQQQ